MVHKQSLIRLKMLLFFFHATNTIILTFLPLYLKDKGLTGTEIGWVLAIGPFAAIIAQPIWGFLSDKYKTVKKVLIVAITGMLLFSVVFFQMNQLVAILIFAGCFYFFQTPVGALADSLAQRRANELKVSFGSIRMWGSIGFGVSALLVAELLDVIGISYVLWPYLVMGTVLLIITFFIQDVTTNSKPAQLKDFGLILKNKQFMFFLFIMMFITITHRTSDSYIGIFIAELGGTESHVGRAWFVGVMSEAIIFATAVFWFRKYHPLFFIIIAGALYTMRWFIYGSLTSPTQVIFFQVFHGLCFGIFYVAAFDYVTRLIPKHLQSTGHLIFFSVLFGVSGIFGSLGGGTIIEVFGGNTLYTLLGCITLTGTIILTGYLIYIRRKRI